jgi:hypothetical protein
MSNGVLLDRSKYQPSGRVAAGPLVLSAVALLPVALLMGALLAASGRVMYMMIASPAIAAAGVAGAGYLLMRMSHCRSPRLAGALLGCFGVVMYLFQFPAEAAIVAGPMALLRVDLWPVFLVEAVNNWQFGQPGQAGGNAVPVFNWIFFAVEIFLAGLVAAAGGAWAATPCYCERCGKWMSKRVSLVQPGGAAAAVQGLLAGNLAELPPIAAVRGGGEDHGALEIEGCSHGGLDAEATFYLSAREVAGKGDSRTITALAQQSLLTPDEFVTLVEKCPSLAGQ